MVGPGNTPLYPQIDVRTPGTSSWVAARWTNPEPPVTLVPRVKAPYAIVHGTEDRFIPVRDAIELHDAALSPSRIDIVAGLGHAFEPPSIEAVQRAVDWVLARHAASLAV